MFVITAERPCDIAPIESLLDRTFGPDRRAKTANRYRSGMPPVAGLALVALDRGAPEGSGPVGSIRYWPVAIGGAPALLLGPLAVEPGRKGEGIGRALMRQSLDMARLAGHRIVLLVGEMAYYGQFGFRPAMAHGIVMPKEAPDRLLVVELAPGALAGIAGEITPRRWVRCHDMTTSRRPPRQAAA